MSERNRLLIERAVLEREQENIAQSLPEVNVLGCLGTAQGLSERLDLQQSDPPAPPRALPAEV